MEVLFGIIALALTIAMPFMIIVLLVRVCCIQREIEDIKVSLVRLSVSGKEKKAEEKKEEVVTPLPEPLPELVPAPEPVTEPVTEPEPEPVSVPEPVQEVEPEQQPEQQPAFEPVKQSEVAEEVEMSVFDIFWAKFEDWFCVRGDFAPKGMTREFAVATRWLTRVGAVLLVGAIAYFLVLAIDKGWIGPVQRVYGMMAWGVIGTTFGTWLKLKSERYAILGEVCAAVGLVALYLSFGLGHRYFKPPVIASGYVAFAGLFAATIAAGSLSVRLRSLMIAGLALVGGFLVPTICSFTNHDVQLHVYLFLLSIGVSALFSQVKCGSCSHCNAVVAYMFHALEYALFIALTVRAVLREGNAKIRPCYWIAAAIAGIFCLCKLGVIVGNHLTWHGARALHHLGWAAAFSPRLRSRAAAARGEARRCSSCSRACVRRSRSVRRALTGGA